MIPNMFLQMFTISVEHVYYYFPKATGHSCYFHLRQTVYRKMQSIGLKGKYYTDVEFQICVKMLTGIAFVPINYIFKHIVT